MEDLQQQLNSSELNNMNLLLENEALKVVMISKDSKWRNGKTQMLAGIATLESELKNAKVVQRGLESELREMGKRLIMKDKDKQFPNNPPKESQAVIQRITEELREYKKKFEDVDREKDEVIATFKREKTVLVDKNDELMAKLKTTQTQILQSETDCNLKVNFIENQLSSEQLENVVCVQRIKELESLVETTEKKWLNVQEDLQKNVELMEKLTAMQTLIHQLQSDWGLKVNTLEDRLRSEQVETETCLQIIEDLRTLLDATEEKWLNVQEDVHRNVKLLEKLMAMQTQTDWDVRVNNQKNPLRSGQVEKETCLQIIKELKSLVEATEKKLLNVPEDSQHKSQKINEDLKFLIVKTIKFQELVLMSDSDKTRRTKDERKAQKEKEKSVEKELKEKKKQEKREKKQREKELKEKKKQEKTENKQREKEAKKEKRKTISHLPSPC